MGKIKKGVQYLKKYGWKKFIGKIQEKLTMKFGIGYGRWRRRNRLTKGECLVQKSQGFSYEPMISVVVPLYHTPLKYLKALIRSVQEQTYGNWELCLSEGSGDCDPKVKQWLQELCESDQRIRVSFSNSALGIAENTNAALAMAKGSYLAFADHDDLLSPEALFSCVHALNETDAVSRYEFLYSDEDKVSMNGRRYFEPHFKPDLNPDLLLSMNYICHLVVISRGLYEKVGGLQQAYNGAQDYDFVLRCMEQQPRVCHIPKVLYHWRSHRASTAADPKSKQYAFDAGKRALEDHLARLGIDAQVEHGSYPGLYHVQYKIPKEEPLVSVIIPNKDAGEDLMACVRSIEEHSTYQNLEYLIIENNSTVTGTFDCYGALEKENPKVRILPYYGAFHYAKINNFAVSNANGEYLLFLNNDTRMIAPDSIKEMLAHALRPKVGAVGAKLLYPDDTIQHAGVVMGVGGIANHCFVGLPADRHGYQSRAICVQNYSAVTAACMMTSKKTYEEVGGMAEDLAVAFNDMDYCMKLGEAGKSVVYTPYSLFYHEESKSRGRDTTPEKAERFAGESRRFLERWQSRLEQGDPYYNPNLSDLCADFRLGRNKRGV